jgi:4-amino-4-deoxy-L-arabinose transferase-like glycosyltransferase
MPARWTALLGVLSPAGLLTVLLLSQLASDPVAGVSFSNSPFTDEAWNTMGARNQVLLGDWSAGNWALHIVQLPFDVLVAGAFWLLGVGIVQARLVAALCSVATVALVTLLVRRRLGTPAGLIAGLALAATGLVLYYGHLVYVETLVMLALVAGTAALCWQPAGNSRLMPVVGGVLLAVAIGSKPSAAFAAAGVLLGISLAMRRRQWTIRASFAAGAVALVALAWSVLIALPNLERVEWVLEILASQSLPSAVGGLLDRILHFPETDDGFLLMSLPLVVGGVMGMITAIWRWSTLDEGQRALAGAATGWLAIGLGLLLVVSYRPNRYALPLLPALAILTAYLVPAVEAGIQRLQRPRLALPLTLVASAVLVIPGLVMHVDWAVRATSRLPAIQAETAAAMDGRPLEGGLSGLFAMRAPVPIYIRWSTSDVNTGDLYATAGVRWLVMADAYVPTWAAVHADAWRQRRAVLCYEWGRGTHCLVQVP